MSMMTRGSGFFILALISSILGAFEGSALCYLFSGFSVGWLAITLSFGLALLGSLVWARNYLKVSVRARSNPYSIS
jgi:hypothetical protein